jgi:hypothetical protein
VATHYGQKSESNDDTLIMSKNLSLPLWQFPAVYIRFPPVHGVGVAGVVYGRVEEDIVHFDWPRYRSYDNTFLYIHSSVNGGYHPNYFEHDWCDHTKYRLVVNNSLRGEQIKNALAITSVKIDSITNIPMLTIEWNW